MSMSERRTVRGTGGRKSKGERVPCTIRFPPGLHSELIEAARQAGYETFQDFIVDLVVRSRDARQWPVPGATQERLPIGA
jgi:hypothetical protein